MSYRLVYYYVFNKVPTFKTIISSFTSYSKKTSERFKIEPHYYVQAEHEIVKNNVEQGLWSKALVKAKGNEDARKAEYIKLRAKQLQNLERGV